MGEESGCQERMEQECELCPSGTDGVVIEDPGTAKKGERMRSQLLDVFSPGPVARWEERMLAWQRARANYWSHAQVRAAD